MSGYVKLFSSILTSSVWGEADSTRIVWITLLALADRNGEAMASVGGLARSANMEREACERAIEVLSSPDPDDRSGVRDGVRIEKIQGGWRIINFAAYREKMRAADRTEYLRRKQAESRARRRARAVNKASTCQPSQPLSTGINRDQPIAASSTTTETTKETTSPKAEASGEREFEYLWRGCAKKVGKAKAMKAYLRLRKAGGMPQVEMIVAALTRLQQTEQWTRQGRQYQPHLETWLNRGGWDDELPETNGSSGSGSTSGTPSDYGIDDETRARLDARHRRAVEESRRDLEQPDSALPR